MEGGPLVNSDGAYKSRSEGVKGAENERQEVEVDEVIPVTQPSSNETDGGF